MLWNVRPGLPASSKIFLDLTECVQRSVNEWHAEPERRVRLRLDAASAGRGRVSSGGERAAQSGSVCRVRKRQESGNRVVVGRRRTTLWGSVRGRERRRDVATNRKKGRRNGGRREFALSASRVNCWLGRSAPDHQAPRTEPSSKLSP